MNKVLIVVGVICVSTWLTTRDGEPRQQTEAKSRGNIVVDSESVPVGGGTPKPGLVSVVDVLASRKRYSTEILADSKIVGKYSRKEAVAKSKEIPGMIYAFSTEKPSVLLSLFKCGHISWYDARHIDRSKINLTFEIGFFLLVDGKIMDRSEIRLYDPYESTTLSLQWLGKVPPGLHRIEVRYIAIDEEEGKIGPPRIGYAGDNRLSVIEL